MGLDKLKENYASRLVRMIRMGDLKNFTEHLKKPEFDDFQMGYVGAGKGYEFHYAYVNDAGKEIRNIVKISANVL